LQFTLGQYGVDTDLSRAQALSAIEQGGTDALKNLAAPWLGSVE
jgi:hypothetical protein